MDSRCKIYELDACDGYGRVCLVFRESKAGKSFNSLSHISLSFCKYR